MLDPHPAGVEAREVEQVGGELRQPRHLLAHRFQELLARLLVEILVGHQLQEPAEGEERRAQLVRRVRDELAPGALEVLEPAPHPLERVRQLAELVSPAIDDRLVEAPAGDALDGALEPPDPARVQRSGAIADDQPENEPDQSRDQQSPLDEMHARQRIDERVAEQDDDVGSGDGNRNLGVPALLPLDGGTLRHPARRRPPRDLVALHVSGRRRVRVPVDRQQLRRRIDHDEDHDPRVHDRRSPLGIGLIARDLGLQALGDRVRVLLELAQLRVRPAGPRATGRRSGRRRRGRRRRPAGAPARAGA